DYLVKWQAQWMGQVYEFLGLTVGYIQPDMDPHERRKMYACDITYVENSELGFDYLRDNMAFHKDELVLRDLYYAIVDEVDSILIDEARTPLIISGMPTETSDDFRRVSDIIKTLRGFDERKLAGVMEQDRVRAIEESGADYSYDEKRHVVALTDKGYQRVEAALGVTGLEQDLELNHIVNACLKAHVLFHRDKEYVVKDGEVIIVDEFTGRLQPGRRYSDGLHQAIEAKEGVKVEMERQTIATITYQNFFRLYEHLAGMTGTAKTEEPEFTSIYGMRVVVIPTNKPMIRIDHPDVVYKTEEAKFRGIAAEILQLYARQQPVLVGTRSVEVSEMLSERLAPDRLQLAAVVRLLQDALRDNPDIDREDADKYREILYRPLAELNLGHLRKMARQLGVPLRATDEANVRRLAELLGIQEDHLPRLRQALQEGIPHNVLNAKYHEQEAQIIAEAGRLGAVTIATNMAGRGVDIVLGGKPEDPDKDFNPEYEDVKALGGLHILGTERHESRRIDNQLRGRSGRQGDPGSSRFYLSLEDELWRLFGGQRIAGWLKSWPEEEPIENRMVTRSIENAQKKVETMHFGVRRDVLKYDDVMDVQRKLIYGERRKILLGDDMMPIIEGLINRMVDGLLQAHADPRLKRDDWDLPGLWEALANIAPAAADRMARQEFRALAGPALEDALDELVAEAFARGRSLGHHGPGPDLQTCRPGNGPRSMGPGRPLRRTDVGTARRLRTPQFRGTARGRPVRHRGSTHASHPGGAQGTQRARGRQGVGDDAQVGQAPSQGRRRRRRRRARRPLRFPYCRTAPDRPLARTARPGKTAGHHFRR
ncbi:MAG: hypothetical protein ACE5O2_12040, partial [Armatimonadota bacterium]